MDNFNFWVDKESAPNLYELVSDLNLLAKEMNLTEPVAVVERTPEGAAWVSLNVIILGAAAERLVQRLCNPSRVVQIPGQMKMFN